MCRITIEEKNYKALECARIIRQALLDHRRCDGWVGVADAVMLTGLPKRDVLGGFLYLGSATNGRLRHRNGQLEILPGSHQARLRLPSWLNRRIAASWPALRAVLIDRALLACMSFLFVSYFIVLIVPLPHASTPIQILIYLALASSLGAYFMMGSRVQVPHIQARSKAFINFGRERRGRRDPLFDERNFLGLLVERGGWLTIGDLMVLYGWSYHQAFCELTRLMLDYGGEVVVSEDGRLLFDFTNLQERSDVVARDIDLRSAWEVERSPSEIFDSAARRIDTWILGLWGFALTTSLIAFYDAFGDLWLGISTFIEGIGPVLSISTIGLLTILPLYIVIRRIVVAFRQTRFARRAKFLSLLRRAKEQQGQVRIDPAEVEAEIVVELGGKVDENVDSRDRLLVIFDEFKPLTDDEIDSAEGIIPSTFSVPSPSPATTQSDVAVNAEGRRSRQAL